MFSDPVATRPLFLFLVKGSVNHSAVSDSLRPRGLERWAPLFMEFSREEYWNGQPFSSPGDLPDPGVQFESPALQALQALQADSFRLSHQRSPSQWYRSWLI